MLTIPYFTADIAKKYGFPLPTTEMTDDEFEQRIRYKCPYVGKGWKYLDDLPSTNNEMFYLS